MITSLVLAAVGYGAAGWFGAQLGSTMCRGRVPFSDGPAPIRYHRWMLALAAGLIGVGVAAHGAAPVHMATIGVVLVFLAACTVADFTCGIVPDLFTLVPLGALVISAAAQRDFGPAISAAIVALPFAGAATLSRGHGMGWGDVKLAAVGGALLGARDATLAFTLACVALFAVSLLLRARGKPVAFAPYLAAGIGAELIIGSSI
ncbi:MAG: prepilin peptidase [Candidatus Baltobacteraceae bacterium]